MSLNSSFIQRNLQYVSRSDRSKVVGVHLFWGQKVKGQGHESQNIASVGLFTLVVVSLCIETAE